MEGPEGPMSVNPLGADTGAPLCMDPGNPEACPWGPEAIISAEVGPLWIPVDCLEIPICPRAGGCVDGGPDKVPCSALPVDSLRIEAALAYAPTCWVSPLTSKFNNAPIEPSTKPGLPSTGIARRSGEPSEGSGA